MAINGIFSALSGMNAHRAMLDTAAHNVTNQLTPGYRRQVVDVAPANIGSGPQVFTGPGSRVTGVEVIDTRRVLDQAAESRAQRSVAAAVDASTTHSSMTRIEDVFGEPTENGIAAQLDTFFVSWSGLADRADDTVARTEVLSQASSLADRFRQVDRDLTNIDADANTRLGTMASEINLLASQVADLNRSIATNPTAANSLMDERDRLASELVGMAGAEVRESDRGQVAVSIGGRLLVGNGASYDVRQDGSGLVWDVGGGALRPGPSELASLNQLRNETIPSVRTQLDTVVSDLVTEVNSAHRQGYDLNGTTGLDFFDAAGTTAATLALSADVIDQPDRLAAGAPALPGPTAPGLYDGGQAQLLGDLSATGTADSGYRSLVAGLGVDTNAAGRRATSSQQIADRALDQAESVSGVSLDEELATMMAAQRGFEASARVLNIVDDMLQTVIGMIR
ncbi:MAG: flagellar hook-associated protein FlgK [Ilumatobacter sp.]